PGGGRRLVPVPAAVSGRRGASASLADAGSLPSGSSVDVGCGTVTGTIGSGVGIGAVTAVGTADVVVVVVDEPGPLGSGPATVVRLTATNVMPPSAAAASKTATTHTPM